MKKLIMTCALLSGASLVSFAQTAQPVQTTTTMQTTAHPQPAARPQMPAAEERAQRHAQGEQKQLNLNADQYKAVYEAELESNKKIDELRASGTQPTREQFMAVNAAKEEKIKKVLNPEQLQKYQLMNNRQHPAAPAPTAAPAGQPQPMSK